ncbi:hypothetical protein [Acinetobacter cumulans]|uniref:hypothetical protein n=1 Tax=Acinetobacter cumulans TaxID=2136182 RepID=UPI0014440BCE|nr:hypothetical protein [Acinetobacter cumulans]
MNVQNQKTNNQKIDVTLDVDGALMKSGFSFTYKPDYNMSEADFKDLKSPLRTSDWLSTGLIIIGITLLLTSFSKFLSKRLELSTNANIEPWEWIGGFMALFLGLVVWVVGYYTSNPKKMVMKKIEDHFQKHTPSQNFVRSRDK